MFTFLKTVNWIGLLQCINEANDVIIEVITTNPTVSGAIHR